MGNIFLLNYRTKHLYMKRIATLLSFLGLISILTHAQEQLPTEQKVTFGQDGKMYVNKELGVYLWLSTSPDKEAPKHRLKSDSSKKYSNPMYFDTEGYNTLRSPSAVDPGTRKPVYPLRDIIFEVYADGEAPKTTYKFVRGKSIYRSGKLYYGHDPAFVINANDRVSGLEKTYYSINGKSYIEFIDTIKLTAEGETTVKYYSTDRVGNRETPLEKKFTIDNSPPETDYEIDGLTNEKFVSPDAVIKLKSEDNLVGVKTIYYQINNGTRRVYSSPVSVKLLGNGGSMAFWAIDYLNNAEKAQVIGGKGNELNIGSSGSTFEFYVDNQAPTLELDFEGQYSKGNYTYVSGDTKIKVNAEDDKSGVDKIYYSINSKNVTSEYDNGISFDSEGVAYIRINATDYVGNKSTTVTNAYYVDRKAPVTKISIWKPKHSVKDTLFVTSKTKINLTATDNASGVKRIEYAIDKRVKGVFEEPFSLDGKGLTKINYWSTDNVGNMEEKNIQEVFVDDIAPIIYHHFSTTPIGSKTVRELEYTIYPSNVQLYIAATDEHAGGERIEYTINGGAVRSVNPIKGLTAGNYKIDVTAYDVLGNASTQTITFAVE